ncbi:hypothetical protein DSL92_06885 [Billgrantia gudaonensis]|uniref:Uncharacterized protein n=1 Tax=Billgrantia gudaonensis TaxID=376427 RepID=A0A432JIG9_9GAMM|nr:hypothetical protein DSL92_06885 [Halomonas gudaonensis]
MIDRKNLALTVVTSYDPRTFVRRRSNEPVLATDDTNIIIAISKYQVGHYESSAKSWLLMNARAAFAPRRISTAGERRRRHAEPQPSSTIQSKRRSSKEDQVAEEHGGGLPMVDALKRDRIIGVVSSGNNAGITGIRHLASKVTTSDEKAATRVAAGGATRRRRSVLKFGELCLVHDQLI